MNVAYHVFLKEHLNYLIARMFALEGEEKYKMFESVKKVRDLLNVEEELKTIKLVELPVEKTLS